MLKVRVSGLALGDVAWGVVGFQLWVLKMSVVGLPKLTSGCFIQTSKFGDCTSPPEKCHALRRLPQGSLV